MNLLLKCPVLENTKPKMQYFKCCDISWPVSERDISCFSQRKCQEGASLYVMCFAYKLATVVLFYSFHQHSNNNFIVGSIKLKSNYFI